MAKHCKPVGASSCKGRSEEDLHLRDGGLRAEGRGPNLICHKMATVATALGLSSFLPFPPPGGPLVKEAAAAACWSAARHCSLWCDEAHAARQRRWRCPQGHLAGVDGRLPGSWGRWVRLGWLRHGHVLNVGRRAAGGTHGGARGRSTLWVGVRASGW